MYVPAGAAPAVRRGPPRGSVDEASAVRSTHVASLFVSWVKIMPALFEMCGGKEQTFNTRFFAKGRDGRRYFGPATQSCGHCLNGQTGLVSEDTGCGRRYQGGRLFNPTKNSPDELTMRARLAVLVQDVRVAARRPARQCPARQCLAPVPRPSGLCRRGSLFRPLQGHIKEDKVDMAVSLFVRVAEVWAPHAAQTVAAKRRRAATQPAAPRLPAAGAAGGQHEVSAGASRQHEVSRRPPSPRAS